MAQNQGLPSPAYQFVDQDGKINPVWFQFLNSLWQRTGGGSQLGNVQSVSATGQDGITTSVSNPTTTPEITVGLNVSALPLFTATTPGVVPASGGGIINFLRADDTWGMPTGLGGTVTTVSVTPNDGVTGTVATPTTTPAIELTLGTITPVAVTTGALSATTGTFSSTMKFGTFTATPITNTGFITITDSGGTSRRLMVG